MDANDFAAELERYGTSIVARVEASRAELADEILQGVRAKTPVKTGRAWAGWEVRPGQTGGTTTVVRNDVPYIAVLEHGTAKRRGLHMLELTVEEALVHHDYA